MLKVKESKTYVWGRSRREYRFLSFQVEAYKYTNGRILYFINGLLYSDDVINERYPLVCIASCIDDINTAFQLADKLNAINKEQKDIKSTMHIEVVENNNHEYRIVSGDEE